MRNVFENGLSPDLILDMLRRRLWLVIVLFSVILTLSVSLIVPLPNIYTARALILVEGQQIPTDFVRSTVTMGVERRLQVISQEILSRSRLGQLVDQFDLYQDLKQQGALSEQIASAMRRDIGIQIKGSSGGLGKDTVAFEVAYTNLDPHKAMDVANTLASLYIKENIEVRERQAMGTTEFLQNELDTAKKRLEEQEQQVMNYRQQHFGELPEQLEANLNTLTLLQSQLGVLSTRLTEVEARRRALLRQTAELQTALAGDDLDNQKASVPQLEALQATLTALQVRFSDKHPDVVHLKHKIAAVEEQLKNQATAPQSASNDTHAGSPFHTEQAAIDAEIQSLSAQLNKVHSDTALYRQRVEDTPQREQELLAISRNYNTTNDLYTSLFKRLQEASLSDSLEQRQKAERFRLLEPAVYPTQPAAPQRVQLLFFGLILSLGAAAGGVLVWETFDPSVHRVEELKALTQVPVLVTIPQIVTEGDRSQIRHRRFLGAAVLAVSLLVLVCVSYRLAVDNERLAIIFLKPGSGTQLRQ
jgi:polysaccharide chain length determinant protein (PEP-CTERM system associated)